MARVSAHDDERAFAQLVRRWEGPIQRLCTRMTGDLHRAEDLTQDAFVRVFARRKDYQPTARFSTWLWRIALNLCYDELRRRRRREEFPLESGGGSGEDAGMSPDEPVAADITPDEMLAGSERGEWVRRALMQLPEAQRAVLVLRHYEGLKFREIAEVLDLPEGTVKSRTADALTRMSRLLEPLLAESRGQRPGARGQTKESLVL